MGPNGEKILSNVNVVVWGQVTSKSENRQLPVAVRVSNTRVLKLPNDCVTTTNVKVKNAYADDSQLHFSHESPVAIETAINEDLKCLWSKK